MQATLFTCSYRKDLERFKLLRESIEACGVRLPHVAVIDHEDMPLFRDQPHQSGLTLVSTREVLPKAVEHRRLGYHRRRRQPAYWYYRLSGRPCHGWGIQQVIKLCSPRVVTTPVIVSIDCDTVFVRSAGSEEFVGPSGKPLLYETDAEDLDAEMAAWPATAMRWLGVKSTGKALYRYTHSPVVFNREVLADATAYLSGRHQLQWESIVLDHQVMEYTLYGVFAREVDGLARVEPGRPDRTARFWWKSEVDRFTETWDELVDRSDVKMVAVQSNAGADLKRMSQLLRRTWAAGGAAITHTVV